MGSKSPFSKVPGGLRKLPRCNWNKIPVSFGVSGSATCVFQLPVGSNIPEVFVSGNESPIDTRAVLYCILTVLGAHIDFQGTKPVLCLLTVALCDDYIHVGSQCNISTYCILDAQERANHLNLVLMFWKG